MDGSFNYIESLGWSLDAEAKRMNGVEEDKMDEEQDGPRFVACEQCGYEYPVGDVCPQCLDDDAPVNETQVEDLLREMFGGLSYMEADDLARADLPAALVELASVRTFAEADLLTSDQGLVLTFSNGQEYQITIKRRK